MRLSSVSAPATPMCFSPRQGSPWAGQGAAPRTFDCGLRVRDFPRRDKAKLSRATGLTPAHPRAHTGTMSRKSVSVGGLVDSLKAFEGEPLTRDRLLHYFQETTVDRSSLDPYLYFRSDMYTRNLIYSDELIELMAVCWQPGQRT